jgi:triosephosphate isomerase (TIM)
MAKRIPIIAANWKMYKTGVEAAVFLETFFAHLPTTSARVLIAPPFTILHQVAGQKRFVEVGAQNLHEANEGAFTGEISAHMLKAAGASFVLVGHSERRRLFGDTDSRVHLKVKQALTCGLCPVLCVGETLEERDGGQMEAVLTRQLQTALADLAPSQLILAYEPVWAIGTGKSATPEMAAEAHLFCRTILQRIWGKKPIPILYGGSVTPETAPKLAAQEEIDGALVGGASLDPHKFIHIIQGFSL